MSAPWAEIINDVAWFWFGGLSVWLYVKHVRGLA